MSRHHSQNPWKLPNHWEWTSLKEIGQVVSGGTPSTKSKEYWNGTVNWISPADLSGFNGKYIARGAKSISRLGLDNSSAKLLPTGAVLFSSRAPVGYVAIAAEPLATNQGFKNLVPQSGIDPEYLYYYLKASKDLAEARASGTTFKELSGKAFSQLPIAVPPLNEQRRIVAKIEELFSELDNGLESLKDARAQLKTYRQSLLKAAFEGCLTEQWRRDNADRLETADQLLNRIREERKARYEQQLQEWKSAVTNWEADGKPGRKPRKPNAPKTVTETPKAPESDMPASWGMIRIADVADVGTGVTPLKKRTDYYEEGTIPWVTSGAVNDAYVREPSGYVTERALNETNLRLYPVGTLLVAMYGEGKTRGKASELAVDATTNQALAAISCHGGNAGIQPYLKWFLIHNYEQIRRFSSGGVQPNLNLGIIENTAFPLCSFEEQKEIVNRLEVSFSRIREMERTTESTLRRSEALRQSILKRAFEGKLVRQDPGDEPASALLDRIRAEQEKEPKSTKGRRKANA